MTARPEPTQPLSSRTGAFAVDLHRLCGFGPAIVAAQAVWRAMAAWFRSAPHALRRRRWATVRRTGLPPRRF